MSTMYNNRKDVSVLIILLPYGHTAISRKVVGKSAHDNPERHCGWF